MSAREAADAKQAATNGKVNGDSHISVPENGQLRTIDGVPKDLTWLNRAERIPIAITGIVKVGDGSTYDYEFTAVHHVRGHQVTFKVKGDKLLEPRHVRTKILQATGKSIKKFTDIEWGEFCEVIDANAEVRDTGDMEAAAWTQRLLTISKGSTGKTYQLNTHDGRDELLSHMPAVAYDTDGRLWVNTPRMSEEMRRLGMGEHTATAIALALTRDPLGFTSKDVYGEPDGGDGKRKRRTFHHSPEPFDR